MIPQQSKQERAPNQSPDFYERFDHNSQRLIEIENLPRRRNENDNSSKRWLTRKKKMNTFCFDLRESETLIIIRKIHDVHLIPHFRGEFAFKFICHYNLPKKKIIIKEFKYLKLFPFFV